MSRALRGALARRSPLLSLAAVAAVVTSGTITVLGFSEESGASPWLALPLLLIGLVSLPTVGRELAIARRSEVAVARLRGVHGPRFGRLLIGEAFVALLVGVVVGVVVGPALTWVLTDAWLGKAGLGLGGATWLGAGAVLGGGIIGVAVGLAGASREPLGDLLQPTQRPRAASLAAIFFAILVIVGAVVAVYRSGRGGDAADPDLLVLAGPALIGLAVGQMTLWLLALMAKAAARLTTGGRLPAYLASRRVARTSDSAGALRLLIAAGSLAVVALTAVAGATSWSERSAQITAGAARQIGFEDIGAADALALTEEADPDGKWLLAAVSVPSPEPKNRRVFLDTGRLDRVSGDFLDGTPAGDAVRRADTLAVERPAPIVGTTLTVTGVFERVGQIDVLGPIEYPNPAAALRVDYVGPRGDQRRADLLLRRDAHRVTAPISGNVPVECDEGCAVTGLSMTAGFYAEGQFILGAGAMTMRLVTLELGETDLAKEDWKPVAGGPAETGSGRFEWTPRGLIVETEALTGDAEADTATAREKIPVLAADLSFTDEVPPIIETPGGDDRSASLVADVPALPLIGTAGLMADLRTALYGSSPTIPSAEVAVLARADTPAAVLAPLREAGGTVRDLDDIAKTGELASGVERTRTYALVSGCCVLVALLALLSSTGRQRLDYQRDVAALRVVGVTGSQIRSAGRRELGLLCLVAALAGVAGGLVASRLLLADLPLVEAPPFSIPVDAAANLWPALGVGALLGLLVLLAASRARRVSAALTRPATLREVAG